MPITQSALVVCSCSDNIDYSVALFFIWKERYSLAAGCECSLERGSHKGPKRHCLTDVNILFFLMMYSTGDFNEMFKKDRSQLKGRNHFILKYFAD